MREAGLGTLQGTAAEILVDEVPAVICPSKCDTATWLRVIREAHAMGIRSTATIMYGAGESGADRVTHLDLLRGAPGRDGRVHRPRAPELRVPEHPALSAPGWPRPGRRGGRTSC